MNEVRRLLQELIQLDHLLLSELVLAFRPLLLLEVLTHRIAPEGNVLVSMTWLLHTHVALFQIHLLSQFLQVYCFVGLGTLLSSSINLIDLHLHFHL
mmetsp:Transcript_21344/g.20487  ORF Transcript_21344/g.20487 Transcript_21344/m.20487 type:complete len:97 (-) Transcript_21344:2299-2589(-)